MPEQNDYYYAEGRRIPLSRDPDRFAVRYSEPTRALAADAAVSRRAAEEALGAVERVDLPRYNMAIVTVPAGVRAAVGERATAESLAARDDVEYVTPVYREPLEELQLIPTDKFNVRFKPDVTAAQIAEFNRRNQVEVVEKSEWSDQEYLLRVSNPKQHSAVEMANRYYESDLTEWSEPDFLTEGRKHALPNDTLLANQWHLNNTGQGGGSAGEDVHADEAWDITTGDPSIAIAIMDDGVDGGHTDLSANIHPNGYDFFDGDGDANPRYYAAPFNTTNDNDIHGTPCAGIAAAAGNNGRGVAGIAYDCRILPIKVWGAPNLAPNREIANAIRYAARHARVLSGSWSSGTSDVVRQAIRDVTRNSWGGRGAAVFFSSGNDPNWVGAAVAFPARTDDAIAVGASTNQGQRSGYSNFGAELDFVAPSNGGTRGIWSTDVSTANRGYNLGTAAAGGTDGLYTNSFGGTSAACPLAAGVAALVLSVRPDITAIFLRRLMRESCDHIGPVAYTNGRNDQFGWGRVNAHRALELALAAPIGNMRSKELHRWWCPWYRLMAFHNKFFFLTVDEGLAAGYNGCRFCLREHDTG